MKKTLILLLAALMMTGCSAKGNDSSSSEAKENTASEETTVPEEEEEYDDGYIVGVDDGKLVVLDRDKNKIQDLPLEEDWLYDMITSGNIDLSDNIVRRDFDFDGNGDLAVKINPGAPSEIYQYYLFNPETKLFEECEPLTRMELIAKPNKADQTLSFHSQNSELGYYDTVYKWTDDGHLRSFSAVVQYSSGGEVYREYYEYAEDGTEKMIKKEHVLRNDKGELTDETEELPIE